MNNAQLARRVGLLAVSALLLVGTLSQATAAAPGPDLQDGDLLVGAISENDSWGAAGVIKRVRGGSVSTFCESPFVAGPDLWRAPHDVLVDSRGRVVFLSELGRYDDTRGLYALLRCNEAGGVAEKLAIFGVNGSDSRGYPVPFPDLTVVKHVGGLHLARKTAVVIDDDIAGGKPKTGKEDAYELVLSTPSEFKSLRYLPSTRESEEGARIVPFSTYGYPDATYYGGATYSALENVLGRDREPFRIDVKGTIGGVYFGLRLGLFGSWSEVGGGLSQGSFEDVARTSFVLDNVLDPNRDGGCPPGSISTAVPSGSASGTYGVPAGFGEVAKHRNFGLTVTSNSAATGAGPYLTQFGGVLLDDNPFNDGQALFLRPELGCNAQRKLDFEPILPYWDPTAPTATSNDVTRLVSGTDGLFGTQVFAGRVVQIRAGDRLTTLASGLLRPNGIAAYPANVPAGSNVAIVIRIDSPVNVLVTDSNGKRIGVDASGNVVNDFGPFGYVGDPGEPRFLAIRDPSPGTFSVDAVGTGTGPYAVHAYSVDTDKILGEHIVARGTATPGSTSDHDFTLATDGTVAFDAPPAADTTPPAIVRTVSPEANAAGWHRQDVSVGWSVTDPESGISSSSGCGLSTLVAETAGSTLTCTATNGAGLTSSQSVTVKLDRTPPTITGSRVPAANAHGWNNSNVTANFACADGLSGVAACTSPVTLVGEGAGQSAGGSAVDLAGNTASAAVSGISIDKTAPAVTTSRTPPANVSGWNTTSVTGRFTATDSLSGIDGLASLEVLFTLEGKDQSATRIFGDRAGNTTGATISGVSIDRTAPEASVQYDPQTRDLRVLARDGLSGPVPGPASYTVLSGGGNDDDDDDGQRRRYLLHDQAGNERALLLEVEPEDDGEELTARVEGFGTNKLIVEVEDDDELEQKIELGKGKTKETVKASYDGARTRITVQKDGTKTTETKPGLVLLRLVTNGAVLTVEY